MYNIILYILLFILVVLIVFIIYNYYYNNNNTSLEIETTILNSLVSGSINNRVENLKELLDNKYFTNIGKILNDMEYNERIILCVNLDLEYKEKMIINLYPNYDKLIEEIVTITEPDDRILLFHNLRTNHNIILEHQENIIGNKIIELINLQKDETEKSLINQISLLCHNPNINILIKELKKRNKFDKILKFINDENKNTKIDKHCIRTIKLYANH